MDTLTAAANPGNPNWAQVQKLQEDLRACERRYNLLEKKLEFANGMVRQLRDTLALSHGDKLIMDWLVIGNAERKLKKVLEVMADPLDPKNHDNVRAVFTAVAKQGA